MVRKSLGLLERVHSNGQRTNSWMLVGYHPSWSITWLWALYWEPFWRFYLSAWWKRGGRVSVGVPLFGRIDFCWQESMRRK
jgi:hypothetical protein